MFIWSEILLQSSNFELMHFNDLISLYAHCHLEKPSIV